MRRQPRSVPTRRPLSLPLAVLALVAVIGALNWLSSRNAIVPTMATVAVLSGEVRIARADAGESPSLSVGETSTLQSADEITTGPDAIVRVTFDGGDTIELGGDTCLGILEMHKSPVSRALNVTLALERGTTLTRIRPALVGSTRFAIETRVASITVKGSVFQCDLIDKNHAYVAVYDGVVSVSMGEQTLDLQTGQALHAQLGQTLVPLVLTNALPAEMASSEQSPSATPEPTTRFQGAFPPIVTPTRPGDLPNVQLYTVQEGDTLYSIAQMFGVSWDTIWELNRGALARPELIRPGQQLRVPKD